LVSAHLSSSINLCLPCILSLAKHSSRHEAVAILSADELGCFEEDGGTIGPGHRLPLSPHAQRTFDGNRYGVWVGLMVCAEMLDVVRGNALYCDFVGLYLHRGLVNGLLLNVGRDLTKLVSRLRCMELQKAKISAYREEPPGALHALPTQGHRLSSKPRSSIRSRRLDVNSGSPHQRFIVDCGYSEKCELWIRHGRSKQSRVSELWRQTDLGS
jgi:hypothetical protein